MKSIYNFKIFVMRLYRTLKLVKNVAIKYVVAVIYLEF